MIAYNKGLLLNIIVIGLIGMSLLILIPVVWALTALAIIYDLIIIGPEKVK